MKVKDLIELLQGYDGEMEVLCINEDPEWSDVLYEFLEKEKIEIAKFTRDKKHIKGYGFSLIHSPNLADEDSKDVFEGLVFKAYDED